MNQANKILIAVLAAQVGLIFVTFRTGRSTKIEKSKPVLAGFNAAKVTRVDIYSSPKKSDNAGKGKTKTKTVQEPAVVLEKTGKAWTVASSAGYAADKTKVSDFLSAIADMRTRSPLATSKSRHKQLRVAPDNYRRKIVLTGGVGKAGTKTTFYVGTFAGRGKVALRLGGHAETQAVSSDLSLKANTRMTGWVDTTYFKVTSSRISEIQIANATGTFSLERAGTSWISSSPPPPKKGAKLDTKYASSLARQLSTIRLVDAAGKTTKPEYGLQNPQATVTLTVTPPPKQAQTDAGASTAAVSPESYTILIGAVNKDNVYVKEASNPFIVEVNKSALSNVLNITADKLYGIGTAKKSAAASKGPHAKSLPLPKNRHLNAAMHRHMAVRHHPAAKRAAHPAAKKAAHPAAKKAAHPAAKKAAHPAAKKAP